MNVVIEKEHLMEKSPTKTSSQYERRLEGAEIRFYSWINKGYYPSLKAALQAFPEQLWGDPQITNLQQYFDRWDNAIKELI